MNTEINSTQDYGVFKTVISNREIDKHHVAKLKEKIKRKNLLHLNPILVNSSMEIIDGQHRLEAAASLGIPIYYIVGEEATRADIAQLNSNKKNWSIQDYINYWSVEKAPGFDTLNNFIRHNPKIKVSVIFQLLNSQHHRDTNALREGKVDVGNASEAQQIIDYLNEISEFYDFAYSRDFISAFRKIWDNPKFDFELWKHQLNKGRRMLVKCIDIKQYIDNINEIYNRGIHDKNQVRFK